MTPSIKAEKRVAVVIAMFAFAVDIATKEAVFHSFALRESIALTPFFNLGHWLNPGAAFSFLSDAGGWQRYLFSALALIIVSWLGTAMLLNDTLTKSIRVAYGLIVGGAIGNLYDRIFRGAVIDWIDLHWAGWHWPVFNLADCAIVAGAITLVVADVPTSSHSNKSSAYN